MNLHFTNQFQRDAADHIGSKSTHQSKGSGEKGAEEIAEEIWDKYSEHIDDNSFSFERVAGTSIMADRSFVKAMIEFANQFKTSTGVSEGDGWIEKQVLDFFEWKEQNEYEINNRAEHTHTVKELYQIFKAELATK